MANLTLGLGFIGMVSSGSSSGEGTISEKTEFDFCWLCNKMHEKQANGGKAYLGSQDQRIQPKSI